MTRNFAGKAAGTTFVIIFTLITSMATHSQTVTGDQPARPAKDLLLQEKKDDSTDPVKKETPAKSDGDPVDLKETKVDNETDPISSRAFKLSSISEVTAFDKMRDEHNASKKQSTGGAWQFAFAPYLYATGISGTVGAQGRVLEIDASFGNVLSNLDLGLMGAFEARKGKVSFLTDMMWIKLSAERETPGGLYDTAKVGINLFIFDPEVGYRIAGSDKGSLEVVGGVRIWSAETNINVTTGLLPGFDVSQRKTWGAPVVGLRGLWDVTPKFYLSSKFDIGGAGIGADLTTQFYGGVGYRVTRHVAILGGYRYLQVDYDDEEGFLFDTNMNGFLFGAKFTF